MLNMDNAKFHIRLLPFRWYYTTKTGSEEQFVIADKFNS